MKLVRPLLLLSFASLLSAQTTNWDTSGNGMLKGTYYFRHVIYVLSSSDDGSLYDAASSYGSISFSGTGTYTMNLTLADAQAGQLQRGTVNGTYSIAASGQGFLSNPLSTTDLVYGLVNAQGI